MYLAKLQVKNWRSYVDATFDFEEPSENKPIVLIGAMNGHGKTSFLVSLYLGLFGKNGLKHCEGFSKSGNDDFATYKKAIREYRRNNAPPDEPTVVEILFKPCLIRDDEKKTEVRVIRRWYFTGQNEPKSGDSFEEVDVYIDKDLQGGDVAEDNHIEKSHARIERNLFPDHVAPAFFFDGEQAQKLIENMGGTGMKRAVEVMFGTQTIGESRDRLRNYLSKLRNKAGGRNKMSEQERLLAEKSTKRDKLNEQIAKFQSELSILTDKKEIFERKRTSLRDKLSRLGGNIAPDAAKIHSDFANAQNKEENASKDLSSRMSRMGIALGLTRMGPLVSNRLDSEESREVWEGLKQGTIKSKKRVLAVAMPEPPENDPLLGELTMETRELVKQRIRNALDQIYNPPPENCATEFFFGHIKGESRSHVKQTLKEVQFVDVASLKKSAKELRHARETMEDADEKKKRLENQPNEVKSISAEIKQLDSDVATIIKKIGSTENNINTSKAEYRSLSTEIGRLQAELAKLGPDQKRMAVAERLVQAFEELEDELRPKTIKRLETQISKHFVKIADERFSDGKIVFPNNGAPFYEDSNKAQHIHTMSGFEMRAFGIAYSLALAEIIKRRIPFIIDTPIGNADSNYRLRTLKAWTEFDLDQVIILTHDKEVDSELAEAIDSSINQKYLIEFRGHESGSRAIRNDYFKFNK